MCCIAEAHKQNFGKILSQRITEKKISSRNILGMQAAACQMNGDPRHFPVSRKDGGNLPPAATANHASSINNIWSAVDNEGAQQLDGVCKPPKNVIETLQCEAGE